MRRQVLFGRLAALLVAAVLAGCATDQGAADPNGSEIAAQPDDPDDPDEDLFHPSLAHLDRGVVRLERSQDDTAVEVDVTLPATEEQRRRGLMQVPELADGTGMLFDFEEERTGGFWMKDTLVPLDIGFAAADGELLEVLPMEPCSEDPCPTYDPDVVYRYALEVPQGWFAANDLRPGDRLEVHDGA